MKKSLSIETMFNAVPFYERFAKAREAGFEYVEFDGWTELDFTRVSEQLSRHELKLASISGARNHSLLVPEQREDFLEYLSQTIAVAKTFKCVNIVIASDAEVRDSVRLEPDAKSEFTRIAAATRAFMDASQLAAKAGMTLLLKSFGEMPASGRLRSLPSAGDVVRVVNSPALRLLYEVPRGEEFDAEALAALGKYRDVISYVHVCDSPGHDGSGNGLAGIRAALTKELAYTGFVGFKFRTNGDEATRLEEIRNF